MKQKKKSSEYSAKKLKLHQLACIGFTSVQLRK